MQFKNVVATLAVAGSAAAQGRGNQSICDYYTTATLKDNTAANQLALLTQLVHTTIIGNYSQPPPSVAVPGILANGTVNGTHVNMLPYFDGGLASTNRGGKAVAVNFLDDGGAIPLMMNKPANGTSSNQYFLLTHLYQFFGSVLGCSQQGMPGYDNYSGVKSMFDLHRFMNLNNAQMTYFIQQVGAAATSFGVADDDVKFVGTALTKLFANRCSPNVTIANSIGSQKDSICQAADCPIDPMGSCNNEDAMAAAFKPAVADKALAADQGDASASVTATAPNGGKPTEVTGSSSGSSSSGSSGSGSSGSSGSGSSGSGSMSSMSPSATANTGSGSGSSSSGSKTSGTAAASTPSSGAAHIMGSGLAAGLGLFAFLL